MGGGVTHPERQSISAHTQRPRNRARWSCLLGNRGSIPCSQSPAFPVIAPNDSSNLTADHAWSGPCGGYQPPALHPAWRRLRLHRPRLQGLQPAPRLRRWRRPPRPRCLLLVRRGEHGVWSPSSYVQPPTGGLLGARHGHAEADHAGGGATGGPCCAPALTARAGAAGAHVRLQPGVAQHDQDNTHSHAQESWALHKHIQKHHRRDAGAWGTETHPAHRNRPDLLLPNALV